MANHSRKFYREVREIRKGYQPTTQILEDDNGDLISDKEQIITTWREYFLKLLNCHPSDQSISQHTEDSQEEVEPLNFSEVQRTVKKLKNIKAPGIDGVSSELWKSGGDLVQSKLFELLLKI